MGLFISIISVIFILYNVSIYYSRRADTKATLRSIENMGSGIRQLTPEEFELIEPYLFNPQKKKPITLNSDQVYFLSGEYCRHGLNDNGREVWHDTIGGIEVILPYDSTYFLQENNEIEFVIADRFAIILKLNQFFDVAGGKERQDEEQQEELDWQQGVAKTEVAAVEQKSISENIATSIKEVLDIEDAEINKAIADEIKHKSFFQVIRQRKESINEAIARSPIGAQLGIACLFAGVAILLYFGIVGSTASWYMNFSIAAFFLLVFALYKRFKKPTNSKIGKVNIVSGYLNKIGSNNQTEYILGSKHKVTFPKHWSDYIQYDKNIDLELRTDDMSVVRMNKTFSIDKEIADYPPISWGRHLTLSIIGLGILIIILSNTNHLRSDFIDVWSWLNNKPVIELSSPQELNKYSQLPIGSKVKLTGNARCEIDTRYYDLPINCSRIRWQGQPPIIPEYKIEEPLSNIISGEFLRLESNPRLDLLLEMRRSSERIRELTEGKNYTNFNRSEKIVTKTLSDISATVNDFEQFCDQLQKNNSDIIKNNCNNFKNRFVDLINQFSDSISVRNWTDLKQKIKKQILSINQVTILKKHSDELMGIIEELTEPVMSEHTRQFALQMAASQRGGTIIDIEQGSYSTKPNIHRIEDIKVSQRINYYKYLSTTDMIFNINISGIVHGNSINADGTPILTISSVSDLNKSLPQEFLLLLLTLYSLWLSGWFGCRAIISFIKNRQRSKAIDNYYTNNILIK